MAILFSNEILNSVKNELRLATDSVQIITAYCKEDSLQYLDECINQNVKNKRLLVRFRMDDVLKGSTDFSALEYALNTGWNVHIRFDLHAKTYVVDNKRGLVGSANATGAGLGLVQGGNMEMATLVDIEPQDIEKIEKLFANAIIVNNDLLHKMKKQIDAIDTEQAITRHSWDSSITKLFEPRIDTLFSHELPEKVNLLDGEYISFLDEQFTGDKEVLKNSFRWSNAYLWLLSKLKEHCGCMYFGAITQELHNALISDPKPYRRDVKIMLSNLIDLIELLQMEEVVIDRPNYSQRIQLK